MNEEDRQRLEQFYSKAFKEFGEHDPQSVHWADAKNQRIRFDVLTQILERFNNKIPYSILDVGCGLADLYKYFLQNNIAVEYTGIDIVTEFITIAQERYPEATFLTGNFDTVRNDKKFDVIFASGALSFKIENYKEYYFAMIQEMYRTSKKAVAFNMLLQGKHLDDAEFATYDPNEVVDFCKTFCDNVEVYTDYLPMDFTVYLLK